MSQNRTNDRNRDDNDNAGFWGTIAAVGVGAAALVGGVYMLTRKSEQKEEGERQEPETASAHRMREDSRNPCRVSPDLGLQVESEPVNSVSNYLSGLFERMQSPKLTPTFSPASKGVPRSRNVDKPPITNLNGLLDDIYVEYIALKDDDFELYYRVFTEIFYKNIHQKMKEVDKYYNKYYSTIQFAGSHFDSLRIDKPDEFDMDIIIDLPLNIKSNPNNPEESDIVIEPKAPGFVQLKMGKQFQRLPMRDGNEWEINKSAYEWKDERNYLLRSNFIDWFKSVVNRALNKFQLIEGSKYLCYVDGIPYTIGKSESGPAMTLIIENQSRGFKMDFDLVPALKFPEDRWPVSAAYRKIPAGCNASQHTWMVVPKRDKGNTSTHDTSRSWRIALHEQERGLMYNMRHMKQAIRLIKKLRDAQGMKKIASYYVKTLFFWEAIDRKERNDESFWNNNPATIFKVMVKKFYDALIAGRIPYFWNKDNNLIGQIDRGTLTGYAVKLSKLIVILDNPAEYKQVARFLLTPTEFNEYNANRLHI